MTLKNLKDLINEAIKETTKEHGKSNVYIDMVGEIFLEKSKTEAINRIIKKVKEGKVIDSDDWVDFFNITSEDLK